VVLAVCAIRAKYDFGNSFTVVLLLRVNLMLDIFAKLRLRVPSLQIDDRMLHFYSGTVPRLALHSRERVSCNELHARESTSRVLEAARRRAL